MFKIYSKGCEYALKALTTLSTSEVDSTFSVKKLCKSGRVPEAFTRKAFQILAQKKILKATPGPGGGYRFSRHPKEISLLEIVYSLEGVGCFDHCILGLPTCNDLMPCPIHGVWVGMKKGILVEMKANNLFDLIQLNQSRRKTKKI